MDNPEVGRELEVMLDLRVKYKVRCVEGEDAIEKSIDQVVPQLLAFFTSVEVQSLLSKPAARAA